MPRTQDIRRIRELLQRRRRDLIDASEGARRELAALHAQERDPEYEEGAQSELADYTLSALLESQRNELRLIDGALQRMDANVYGECVECGDDIPLERLEALPFALRCAADATRHEEEHAGGRVVSSTL